MSDHHVFAVISGFGLRVTPQAPFEARLGDDPKSLQVEHFGYGPPLSAVITPGGGEAGFEAELGAQTGALEEVADVGEGPAVEGWHIETKEFLVPLPAGFTLHSVGDDSPSPFDLVGPNEEFIYVQARTSLPTLDGMVGPGQTEVGRGADWIEVEYEHDGTTWRQRHARRALGELQLMFTAQAVVDVHAGAVAALDQMLAGLRASE